VNCNNRKKTCCFRKHRGLGIYQVRDHNVTIRSHYLQVVVTLGRPPRAGPEQDPREGTQDSEGDVSQAKHRLSPGAKFKEAKPEKIHKNQSWLKRLKSHRRQNSARITKNC
jgi:hypothetical protein